MNPSSAKRNRNDNFDSNDVDLLLSLIEEHGVLIDNPKIEQKQKGWDLIHENFNKGCSGIKRDINALKMKLKNIKAQSKKTKLEYMETTDGNENTGSNDNEDSDNDHDEDFHGSSSEFKFGILQKRKRCKKFSKSDCDLLIQLYDRYCANLDTSSSATSVKRRSEAWDNLTKEFNSLQTNGIIRDQNELKIKIKNLKASRIKMEPNESSTVFDTSGDHLQSSTPQVVKNVIHNKSLALSSKQEPPLRIVASTSNHTSTKPNNDSQADVYYDEFEVEYINQPPPKPVIAETSSNDKEIEKIRKENLLIKNSVLKKKERLLELQIAIAERNLRRQI